jgi:hypothetical protein
MRVRRMKFCPRVFQTASDPELASGSDMIYLFKI